MVVDAVFDGHSVSVQVGDKLGAVEDFLDVVFLVGQLQIAHAVHGQFVPPVTDDFHATLDEKLWIVQQILQAVALDQDVTDRGALGQRLLTDDGQHVRDDAVVLLDLGGADLALGVADSGRFNMDIRRL